MGGETGGLTVTVKLQLVLVPQLSLAVVNTVVVPIGNVLPLGGMALTDGGGLQPPLAELLKNTTAPFELVAVTVMLDEQIKAIGGRVTVTVKLQLVLLPHESLAVVNTVVVPIENVLPLGGIALTNGGGLQPPLADAVKNTTAPLELVAVTVMFDGQLRLMGGATTVTVKLQLVLLPHESLAVVNTVVVPIENVLPLGGLALTNGGGLQPPLAVTVKNTLAPLELLALTVMFEEQFSTIGGYTGGLTLTVKLQLVLVPQLSLAVVNTVVVPIENVLPLGGLALTNGGGLQPPLADAVKNTTAPLELVAVTVIFDGQLRLMGGATTVTVKLQFVLFPHVSLAVLNTVVVPIGNVLPLGGLAETNGGGLQPPLAVTV